MRWRRGPRCDVCGKRVSITAAERSARFAEPYSDPTELCDPCLQRRGWERALNTNWDRRSGQTEALWRSWLERAPLLGRPTDPVAGSSAAGYVTGRPFVEITDLDTAARDCAGGRRGLSLPPTTHDDVLSGSYDLPPVSITQWTGSVFRLTDGRVVFRWRPLRTLINDY